jgi:hypothetical protein
MSKIVIEQLKKGILPPELNYSLENQEKDIDWAKVCYNSFYKTPEYFASKFPPEWVDTFPCFDQLVGIMAEKAKSPLEEMEERINARPRSTTIVSVEEIIENKE